MYDLNFIDEVIEKPLLINEISINHNYLSNIDLVNKFTKLRTLDASDNYISIINLTLPKL